MSIAKVLAAAAVVGSVQQASAATNSTFEKVRLVVGGSLRSDSPVLDYYKGYPPNAVKYITAAGINPTNDAVNIGNFFRDAGIQAEWIPIYSSNCAQRAYDQQYVDMVNNAAAIYMSGGQSGRVQSCLFGNYNQQGAPTPTETPILQALKAKNIVGGSSAGAMCQPQSEILITGHSVESYQAVNNNDVFFRTNGNGFLTSDEVADVHFSERGRQGRLVVFAAGVGAKWAFGVDENTAYEWNEEGEYVVVGQNGVVVNEDAENLGGGINTALMHYLTPDDTINRETGEVTFASWKTPCSTSTRPTGSNSIFSGLNYKNVANAMAQYDTPFVLDTFHGNPAVQVTFDNSKAEAYCGSRNGQSYVSFKNMVVTQGRAKDSTFINTEKPELPQDYIWEVDM